MTEHSTGVEERLRAYLQAQMPEARNITISDLRRSTAGTSRQNWAFRARWEADGRAVDKKLVLRVDVEEPVVATDQETEFRILRAVAPRVPFPMPMAYWLDTTGWFDRPAMIVEFCEGKNHRNVLNDSSLPLETRLKLARRYTEIMAATHLLDWQALGLSSLRVPQGPKGAAQAQVEKWAPLGDEPFEPQPLVAETLAWLRKDMPESKHICLLHGDFRVGNSLVLGGEVSAMLDWELAHLGDPMEDIGWYTLPLNYDREHFLPGLYHHQEFYRYYEELTGFEVDEEVVRYYRVLGAFKIVVNLVRGYKQANARGKVFRPGILTAYIRWQRLLADLMGL